MTQFDELLELRKNATPGRWGPTTSVPIKNGYRKAKDGERGPESWGAVVSDTDFPRHGTDHPRYEAEDTKFTEKGADYYGGTLVGESFAPGNGEYIARMHNELPGLLATVHVLKTMLEAVISPALIEKIITETVADAAPPSE